MREKIEARIVELEAQQARAIQVYADKDAEINQATQEMSDRIRALRNERGNLAVEAAKCQQAITELRGLLTGEPGGAA